MESSVSPKCQGEPQPGCQEGETHKRKTGGAETYRGTTAQPACFAMAWVPAGCCPPTCLPHLRPRMAPQLPQTAPGSCRSIRFLWKPPRGKGKGCSLCGCHVLWREKGRRSQSGLPPESLPAGQPTKHHLCGALPESLLAGRASVSPSNPTSLLEEPVMAERPRTRMQRIIPSSSSTGSRCQGPQTR